MTGLILDWDSAYWGVKVARVDVPECVKWATYHDVDVGYLSIPSDNVAMAHRAEALDFRLMDIRVVYEGLSAPTMYPHATPWADAPQAGDLAAVARTAHRDSRFYADPRFDDARCGDLYEEWLRRSWADGYADEVLTVSVAGRARGYVTLHDDGDSARVGLIGVAAESRRLGLGTALITAALDWANVRSLGRLTVATQARNLPAQRLFASCGLRPVETSLWFHRWFR